MNTCRLMLVLVAVILAVSYSQAAGAWESDLGCYQPIASAVDEYLICDVLEVDLEHRRLLVQAGNGQQWLAVASDASITRNGMTASLESLTPISEGIFQEAYILLEHRGLVVSVDAWFCVFPVEIVRTQEYPVRKVWVRCLNSSQETIYDLAVRHNFSVLTPAHSASTVQGLQEFSAISTMSDQESYSGLAVISRQRELRYFIPYRPCQ